MSDDYNRGFADGLKCVATALRNSASHVEQTEYGEFERKNGGPVVRAIAKVGQVHFAKQLREVAQTIENILEASK